MKTKKIVFLAATIAVVSVFCCLLHFSGAFTWSENKAYDSRITVTSSFFRPSEEIALVLLDQESLNWAKDEFGWGWPWPREAYAHMIDFFNASGAHSVAFDMVYTEPSVYGPADDAEFARSARDFGKVVQTVYYSTHDPDETPLLPISELKESAGIIGTVQSDFDKDGVSRRNRFYSTSIYQEPSLSVASLLVSGNEVDFDAIPRAKGGGMYVRFQKDLNRFAPYNAKQVIQSDLALKNGEEPVLPPELFEDMYVFFGLYAPGLFDICSSPVGANYPGVGVHVSQMDTILNNSYLCDVNAFVVIILILLFALIGGFMGEHSIQGKLSSFLKRLAIILGVIIIYIVLNFVIFYKGFILPFTAPLLSLILTYASLLVRNYLTEGKQRRYLKHAFSQYLSPKVIDNLIENPDLLKLGGEKREITVYFSDVQGFTSISEKLSPEALTELLNTYLSAMTDIILAHGGTIDKYEGDAIIAFWNAPTYQEDHAKRALEAALECQATLAKMRDELLKTSGKPMYQRIGLNTGYAVVGNMGSSKRFDYTMLGDAVNLASRLEGINKQFGTYTMCSKATMEKAREHGCNFAFRELADIAVVGKTEGVNVFEPMLQSEYNERKGDFDNYRLALEKFTAGDFAAARTLFEKTAGTDPAAAKFVEKCEKLIENPPENWNGVLRATEK